jgi:ankyrin repeat protein
MHRSGTSLLAAGLLPVLIICCSVAFAGQGETLPDSAKDSSSQKAHELRKNELDDNLRLFLDKALIGVCFFDYPGGVRFLLGHGANVNAKSVLGLTPLIVASERDHQEIVQLLLEKGADTNAKKVINGRTALMCACQWGYLGVVKRILERGRDVDVSAKDKAGMTALMIASRNGYTDIVELLKAYEAKQTKALSPPSIKEYRWGL